MQKTLYFWIEIKVILIFFLSQCKSSLPDSNIAIFSNFHNYFIDDNSKLFKTFKFTSGRNYLSDLFSYCIREKKNLYIFIAQSGEKLFSVHLVTHIDLVIKSFYLFFSFFNALTKNFLDINWYFICICSLCCHSCNLLNV